MKRNLWVVLVSLALFAVGCSRIGTRPDAQVASDVQNKINGDSNIPDKQLNINANNGVVTLTGTVASDAARNAAANDAAQVEGVEIFHAGTSADGGKILATGGRVLNICARGKTVREAQSRVYAAVDRIRWPGGFCRRDIGWRAIEREK